MAALESWQLPGHDGELRLGNSLLRGPIERDQHFGTCRIEVRLARGPLRPAARMRRDIEPWSPTATALELIPCQRVRPSAAYFAVSHRLLDSLTRPLPVQQCPDHDYLRAAVSAGGPALSRASSAWSRLSHPSDRRTHNRGNPDRMLAVTGGCR